MRQLFHAWTGFAILLAICLPSAMTAQPMQQRAPKNIIVLISDGWGYNQVMATDYYEFGTSGHVQAYQKFPVKLAMSTYMAMNDNDQHMAEGMEGGYAPDRAWTWFDYVKHKFTDSAASATAISTGVKSYKYCIGLDVDGNPLENIVQRAAKLGKASGVVSSVQWTHATPACFVAHNKYRKNYAELAQEMIYNSNLSVIMGAGHPLYDNDGQLLDQPGSFKYVGGEATWNDMLTGKAGNDMDNDGRFDAWTFIDAKEEFENLTHGITPKRIIGTAQVASTLQNSRSGNTASDNVSDLPYTDPLIENVPTLDVMTKGALNVLDNDPDGFFLMVEGGAIDWAGHANSTPRMIEEQIDFNNTVESVVAWVNNNSSWDETLVIVTGDHETGYLTGPHSGTDGTAEGDETPVWNDPVNNGVGQLPTTEWHSGDHTNQLIPLYAAGQGSQLLVDHADEFDVVRGRYLTNSEIGQAMMTLWPDPAKTAMPPKNIILMISDGWGKNQIMATNFYVAGADAVQQYEHFPVQLYMSTFMALDDTPDHRPDLQDVKGAYEPHRAWSWFDYIKRKPTDSAASASAFATGVKTYKYSMGLDATGNKLENIVQAAEKKGKATGVVSSVQFAHATPAGMAANQIYRSDYVSVAKNMLYESGLDVIMGCGHPAFDNDGQLRDQPGSFKYVGGEATWNELKAGTAGNDADMDGIADKWSLIQTKKEFQDLVYGPAPKRVIGVPQVGATLQYNRSGDTQSNDVASLPYTDPLNENIPDLATMTAGALNVLDNDRDGFFLMVEGGAVDWAGHGNSTPRLIEEQIDFNKAVDAVINWVNANSNWNETLLIVTGDHETGYLTGPGAGPDDVEEGLAEMVWTVPTNNGKGNLPTTEWHSGDHTNQLIPLYAKGSGSEMLVLYADQIDQVRGAFTDNAEVGQLMLHLMRMNPDGYFLVRGGAFQITSVQDVPNDQGKQVRLSWNAHGMDAEGKITKYSIYRKIDTSMSKQNDNSIEAFPSGNWDFVLDVPAVQQPFYFTIVPTLKDSTINHGQYLSEFFVVAHTTDPSTHWETEPMAGYSVDNLRPARVQNLLVSFTDKGNLLSWAKNREKDLAEYRIYRGTTPDFKPTNENLLAVTRKTELLDNNSVMGTEYFYLIAAADFSGNVSEMSKLQVVTGVESRQSVPSEFALSQNYPNPFNPVTVIHYSIPEMSNVTLSVYNTLGQEIVSLVNQVQAAGEYSVQWDASQYPSGTYLYKLEAGQSRMIKRMQLLK